jgi:dCTP deaminase
MLLSHPELVELVDAGVIEGVEFDAINSASIDLTLGNKILVERYPGPSFVVSLRNRDKLTMREVDITEGYVLTPGEFILAHSVEMFHLPNNVSAEYKLKSSMARIGLEHLNAGWADAGWNGSVLTLELVNITRRHSIRIQAGDKIGQMVFFQHEPVPEDRSYAARGRYNNDTSVSPIKE